MPSLMAEPSTLSVPRINASANSSFDVPRPSPGLPRKSHDKTISGVFTYTNGTDTETGLPEHRLEQLRMVPNSSNLGPNSTPMSNGLSPTNRQTNHEHFQPGVRSDRDRAHSNAGSTHSVGSRGAKTGQDDFSSSSVPSSTVTGTASRDGNKRSGVDTATTPTEASTLNGHAIEPNHHPEPSHSKFEPGASADGQPPVHRLSSPPVMSHGAPDQGHAPELSKPAEMPRLAHRHTLQVPRTPNNATRPSREFPPLVGGEDNLASEQRHSGSRGEDGSRLRRASIGLVRRTTRSMASDPYFEDIPPDEDTARWTEAIKAKRASRRKRREDEDDDRVVVGKKVEEGHVNWVTAYNMLTGIRFTVSRTNAKMDRELTDADFDAKHKFSFDITGNELTPSAKYDFKFKDYAPWVFRRLRADFGLDPADYLMSLTSKYILSELGSPGKSGSFFYFSRDYKYIIKTIHHAEHKLLRRVLRDYYQHVRDNPNTLVSQFYGLHRVKIPYGRKIHFVVMNNLFPPHRDIHQTFDLKGSTIGRDFKEDGLASNPRATLKDLNWLRRDLHLEFENHIRGLFLEQLQRDVGLLQKLGIMDYSLLVGIHDLEKGNLENIRETTLKMFQPGGERDGESAAMLIRTPSRLENARKARELRQTLRKEKPVPMGQGNIKMPERMRADDQRQYRIFYSDDGGIRATHENGQVGEVVYYLGVIDCLTHYGAVKRIEHFWKGLSNNSSQISPIPPQPYGDRFLNFITGITATKEEAGRRKTQDTLRSSVDAHNILHHHHLPPPTTGIDEHGDTSRTLSPAAAEKTMEKAQKATDQQTGEKGRRESEEEIPDRVLGTHSEDGRSTNLLPIVHEAHESSSERGSRSGRGSDAALATETSDPGVNPRDEQASGTPRERRRRSGSGHHADTLDSRDIPSDRDAVYSEDMIREEGHSTVVSSKPPRINSGIIPHLGSFCANFDSFGDEEKTTAGIEKKDA